MNRINIKRGRIVVLQAIPTELMTAWARHVEAAGCFLDRDFAFRTFVCEE